MSNERCVWVADSQAMASVMAHWLDQEGVRTKVLDKTNLGISYGINFSKSDPHDHGWQVWVVDSEDLSKAKKMVSRRTNDILDRKLRMAMLGPVDGRCESCGQESSFEGAQRGSVQKCPRCGAYLDVAGGEDEFQWPTFEEHPS